MDFAPLSNNLLAEATKQIIGERRIDMYQTFKTNSRNAGRRQRFGNFMGMLGGAATDYLFSNFSQIVMGSVLQLYMFDLPKPQSINIRNSSPMPLLRSKRTNGMDLFKRCEGVLSPSDRASSITRSSITT